MSDRVSVTRHVEFEAAHLLTGYDGPCQNLHGHSYKLEVTISCPEYDRENNSFNFVIDFSKVNKLLKDYVPDHTFVVNTLTCDCAEAEIYKVLQKYNLRIFEMDRSPSAENMVKVFAKDIQQILEKEFPSIECTVDRLCLWETRDSFATWTRGVE